MWATIKGHPRLYAIGGVLVVIGGGLATIEGIWALFRSEPLVPVLYKSAQAVLPEWPRFAVIVFWLILTLLGGLLVVGIFRQTRKVAVAPNSTRNEVRRALEKLSQTSLRVEYTSFGYEITRKTWLQENQYLWHFNVMLTNTSSTKPVSTKAVSLEVRYNTKNGDVRGYALSLVPDVDKDKYGRASMANGKLLGENEYLRPAESISGFYQFLDAEAFWKPKLMQTWPTLVIVDSFDAPHRKEFSQSRFASRLSPDKEGSQT